MCHRLDRFWNQEGLMGNRVRHGVVWLGLPISLSFVGSIVAYAQTVPAPDDVVKIAEKNALLAVVYILAVLVAGCVYVAWNMYKAMVAQHEKSLAQYDKLIVIMEKQAAADARMAEVLNSRPCILSPPQPKNPHALEAPHAG